MVEMEIVFEEGTSSDAGAFLEFMRVVAGETDYLVMDETGFRYSLEETEQILRQSQASPDDLILLAKVCDEVIGVLSIRTSSQEKIAHVGTVFLAVKRRFWGHGIGRTLLETGVDWAEQTPFIKRLELTVQIRNQAALHLYQQVGFDIEGTQRKGAKSEKGEWLDLYYMGKLLDDSWE